MKKFKTFICLIIFLFVTCNLQAIDFLQESNMFDKKRQEYVKKKEIERQKQINKKIRKIVKNNTLVNKCINAEIKNYGYFYYEDNSLSTLKKRDCSNYASFLEKFDRQIEEAGGDSLCVKKMAWEQNLSQAGLYKNLYQACLSISSVYRPDEQWLTEKYGDDPFIRRISSGVGGALTDLKTPENPNLDIAGMTQARYGGLINAYKQFNSYARTYDDFSIEVMTGCGGYYVKSGAAYEADMRYIKSHIQLSKNYSAKMNKQYNIEQLISSSCLTLQNLTLQEKQKLFKAILIQTIKSRHKLYKDLQRDDICFLVFKKDIDEFNLSDSITARMLFYAFNVGKNDVINKILQAFMQNNLAKVKRLIKSIKFERDLQDLTEACKKDKNFLKNLLYR